MQSSGGKKWLSTIITACTNFSAQYNYQSIGPALLIMSRAVCTATDDSCRKGDQATWVAGSSTAGIFFGSIVGQLYMGFLGDHFSRSIALSWTMIIAAVGTIIAAAGSYGSPDTIYSIIIIFRVFVGIGLGGVFPLASSKSSEDSAKTGGKLNSTAAAWSHFWQFPGFFAPWCLSYILTFTDMNTESQWRFLIGIGALPCIISIILLEIESAYFHTNQPSPLTTGAKLSLSIVSRPTLTISSPTLETDEQTVVANNSTTESEQQLQQQPSRHTMSSRASQVIHKLHVNTSIQWKIVGLGICWFIYNAFSFGIALLSGHIIGEIALNDDDNLTDNEAIRTISEYQMIVTATTVCTAAFGVCLLNSLGLRNLLWLGFTWFTILAFIVTCLFDYLNRVNTDALFGLYCLVYGFMNFGVGSAIYALSAALFPKEIRSTCGGICAAIGKTGAMFGAFLFAYLGASVSNGYTIVLGICTFMAACGAITTYYFIHSHDLYNNDELIERESHLSFLSTPSTKLQSEQPSEFATYPRSSTSRFSVTNPLQQKLLTTKDQAEGMKHPQDLQL